MTHQQQTIQEILEAVALSHGCLDDDGNDWDEQLQVVTKAKLKVEQRMLADRIAARIDELENIAKMQKTFIGYGYDDIGVDIDDIDERIATLKAQQTGGTPE